ncbi:hypothetical protein JCM6882_008018 [Rhodosporidiobolus microsporus]
MLVRLTALDLLLNPMGLCSAFTLALPPDWRAEDTAMFHDKLKSAADRVVRKWPLLTGIPKRQSRKEWAIDVPDDVDAVSKTRALFTFTASSLDVPYHESLKLPEPLPLLSSSRSGYLPQPTIEHFCPPSVPRDLAAREKRQLPLLHLHLTSFTDAFAVGINLPHGAFDGTGMGLVIRALDAELHGREWEAPLSLENNPLEEALGRLVLDENFKAEGELPSPLKGYTDSASPVALMRVASSALWEAAYFKSTERRVFLRQALVDVIVRKVKADVLEQTGGKEYVSSADALTAWLLKNFHTGETDPSSYFAADPVFQVRPLVSEYTGSSFSTYPHGAVVTYNLPPADPIPLSVFSTISVASLALALRRGLNQDRSLPVLRELWRVLNKAEDALIPVKDWPELPAFLRRILPFNTSHTTRWNVSNQTTLGLADIRFPGKDGDLPLLSYYLFVSAPLAVDHYVNWQDVPGAGITFSGIMRPIRWENLERAVEEVEAGLAVEEAV